MVTECAAEMWEDYSEMYVFDIKPGPRWRFGIEGMKFSAKKVARFFKHGINKMFMFSADLRLKTNLKIKTI